MSKTYDEMVEESISKNLTRAVKALKKLEHAKDGACVGCGREVYRDSCVLLRPGFWIAPASFHESGCPVAQVMSDMMKEVIPEEEAQETQHRKEWWARPENQAILDRIKRDREDLQKQIEVSETAKFN